MGVSLKSRTGDSESSQKQGICKQTEVKGRCSGKDSEQGPCRWVVTPG